MKIAPAILSLVLLMTGCSAMIAKAFIPDVNPRMSKEELAHLSMVNERGSAAVIELAQSDNVDEKTKKALVKYLDRINDRASDITPSPLAVAGSQYMSMLGRDKLEEGIKEGFEWTTEMISAAAGGATGVGGLSWLIPSLLGRKRKKLIETENRILKETVKEGHLADRAVDKARYTDVENTMRIT